MKKVFMICILLIAAMTAAQESPSETTGDYAITTIPTPTLEPIPILISEPINITENQTNPTVNETVIPISTIESSNETTPTENQTSLIIETTTTETTQPTLPPKPPECGNLYQEVGEECDTTASSCGAGRWQCIDCKCIELPEETTTTTLLTSTGAAAIEDIQKTMDENNISIWHVVAGIIVIAVAAIAVVYKLGKDDNGKHDKK